MADAVYPGAEGLAMLARYSVVMSRNAAAVGQPYRYKSPRVPLSAM
jgi:hypothetical protein